MFVFVDVCPLQHQPNFGWKLGSLRLCPLLLQYKHHYTGIKLWWTCCWNCCLAARRFFVELAFSLSAFVGFFFPFFLVTWASFHHPKKLHVRLMGHSELSESVSECVGGWMRVCPVCFCVGLWPTD